jgi:diguanylate cyclase (GGDEF)-like protein
MKTRQNARDSILFSSLRPEDKELDQILRALEQISNALKSGSPAEMVSNAIKRAASSVLKQSELDRSLRSSAITDDLTGLYNRRGFWASATHQLKMARRNGQHMSLFFCDVDNLKEVNDRFGHQEGDLLLIRIAQALSETFRDSDIVARVSGDEFAVLALKASEGIMLHRLQNRLHKAAANQSRCQQSLSVGVARFDPKCPVSLGQLMARADQAMYEQKIRHQRRESSQARKAHPA